MLWFSHAFGSLGSAVGSASKSTAQTFISDCDRALALKHRRHPKEDAAVARSGEIRYVSVSAVPFRESSGMNSEEIFSCYEACEQAVSPSRMQRLQRSCSNVKMVHVGDLKQPELR
jgi:hypothetical protein